MAIPNFLRTLLGGDLIFGSAPIREQVGQLNPQQEELLAKLIPALTQQLGQGGVFDYEGQREAALNEFSKGIPSIGERFQALTGESRPGSSGEKGILAGARADLEKSLFGQQQGMRQQNFFNLLNQVLGQKYETLETPQPGLLSGLLGLGGSLVGGVYGGQAGAGLGGKYGGQIGSAVSRQFGTPQTPITPRI